MAARKSDRQSAAPTRRSTRIASKTNSRASSAADSTDSVQVAGKSASVASSNIQVTRRPSKTSVVPLNNGIEKNTSKRKSAYTSSSVPKRAVAPVSTTRRSPFNVDYAIGCILSEIQRNPSATRIACLDSLTVAEKDAVIQRFGERELRLQQQMEEAERRVQEAIAERDAAFEDRDRARMKLKTPMRDAMFQQSLRKRREESLAPAETPSHTRIISATAASPAVASETRNTPHTSNSLDFSTAELITGTPAPVSAPSPQPEPSPEEQVTPKPRSSYIGSLFSTILSPLRLGIWSQGNSSQSQQQTSQDRLGELPASRKRPAPAQEEPEIHTQTQGQGQTQTHTSSTLTPAQQPQRVHTFSTPRASTTSILGSHTARAFTMPSTKTPFQETSLATITEHTESSEQTMDLDPTPVRPQRTIASVRRAQQTPSRLANTPSRSWSKTPTPRDTNADRRLEKLRKFRELNEELETMKEDEEVKQMTERPLKRVKVDTLVKIPHNRPGDASGTFRMPDIDSDDEMEVDADEETRSNIFELSTADEVSATPAKIVPAAAAVPPPVVPALATAPAPAPAPATAPAPALAFEFPDVGKLPESEENEGSAYLGAKFAYGLEHWKATSELLDLF